MVWVDLTVGRINTLVFLEMINNRTMSIRKLSIEIWVVQKFLS
jgi:hypothetical protein